MMLMKHGAFAFVGLVAGIAAIGAMVSAQDGGASSGQPAATPTADTPGVTTNSRYDVTYQDSALSAARASALPGVPSVPPPPNFAPNSFFPGQQGVVYGLQTTGFPPAQGPLAEAMAKYSNAEGDEDREAAKSELREALAEQFEKDVERRKQELEAVAAKLKEMQDMLNKRVESAEKIIDLRMQVLLQDAEGLGWNSAAEASVLYRSVNRADMQDAWLQPATIAPLNRPSTATTVPAAALPRSSGTNRGR